MIPEEWYKFQDWLKEQADNSTGEMHEHFEFVYNEWTSYMAGKIREYIRSRSENNEQN